MRKPNLLQALAALFVLAGCGGSGGSSGGGNPPPPPFDPCYVGTWQGTAHNDSQNLPSEEAIRIVIDEHGHEAAHVTGDPSPEFDEDFDGVLSPPSFSGSWSGGGLASGVFHLDGSGGFVYTTPAATIHWTFTVTKQ